jgi:L-alanine-DL-glutamate epimerase-like enolase superfamily enzyme
LAEIFLRDESFPIAGGFTISRGTKTTAEVIVVELVDGDARGRGECVPYARYGETMGSVRTQLEDVFDDLRQGATRAQVGALLPAGAARNAVDCALWDLEAKSSATQVHELLGCAAATPVTTAYTLSLGRPAAMGEAARQQAARPLLKLKLAGDGDDVLRVAAVRAGAPQARLIVDANEGGSAATIQNLARHLADLEVSLIEQPLPAGADEILADIDHAVPFCADESCHTSADIDRLRHRYDAVNIKLDKTGGLTEALCLQDAARAAGMQIMVGCMLATSLSMAPAMFIAQGADLVDLDGPLLLARDREPSLLFEGSLVHPATPALWG